MAERMRLMSAVAWAVGASFRASPFSSSLLLFSGLSRGVQTLAEGWLVKLILDGLVASVRGDRVDWGSAIGIGVVVTALRLFGSVSTTYVQWPSRERLRLHFEQRVLNRVGRLDSRQMEDRATADLLKKVRDNMWASTAVLRGSVQLLESAVTLTLSLIVLLRYSPTFIAMTAVFMLPQMIILRRRVVTDYEEYGRCAELYRKRSYWLDYLLAVPSQLELRILGALPFHRQRFREVGHEILSRRVRARNRYLVPDLGMNLVLLAVLWWFVFDLVGAVASGRQTIGDFQYYFRMAAGFFGGAAGAVGSLGSLQSVSQHVGDLRRLLAECSPQPATSEMLSLGDGVPHIELRDVSFRYPHGDSWALRNVSLQIPPGERLAIVGENGAGKTTLVKLVMGLYPPTEGRVLIGGIDTRELDLPSWHRHLGLLLQDFSRFSANSLAENVAFSDIARFPDEEAIERAIRDACFTSAAKEFLRGRETILSPRFEGGAELSGGQWQKVAIARMMFRPASVVVLDEPTSAIDRISEARIFERLYESLRGRTVIVVSHRVNTIRAASRILVMLDGRVVEEGSDATLLAEDGLYGQLVREDGRVKRL